MNSRVSFCVFVHFYLPPPVPGASGSRTPARRLYKTNFSPVVDGRVVEKSREKPEFRGPSTPVAEGATHFLAPGKRGWPLSAYPGDPDNARAVAAWLCRRHTEVPPGDLAPLLGLSRADSVPDLTRRMDARLRAHPQLADELQQIMARIEPETKNQV